MNRILSVVLLAGICSLLPLLFGQGCELGLPPEPQPEPTKSRLETAYDVCVGTLVETAQEYDESLDLYRDLIAEGLTREELRVLDEDFCTRHDAGRASCMACTTATRNVLFGPE